MIWVCYLSVVEVCEVEAWALCGACVWAVPAGDLM